MMSLGTGEVVGAAVSGRVLVAGAASLMEMSGRVANTTAVPRIRVWVTVRVEVEVEVVVGSLGAGSCGSAVVRRGRRRMEREREKCGGCIGARVWWWGRCR